MTTFKILLVCLVPLVGAAEDINQLNPDIVTRLALAFQTLSGDILYDYVKDNPGKPYITSIPPLMRAIAQPGVFSKGSTLKEILKILNAKNKSEITDDFAPGFKEFLSDNTETNNTEYYGKVYGDSKKQFTSKFIKLVKDFDEKTGRVNFDESEEAAQKINAEVEEQGKRGFDPLVKAEDVEKGGLLYVSTYETMTKFDQKLIPRVANLNFTTSNETKSIVAFSVMDSVPYAKVDDIQAQVFEYKLVGGRFAILIFYPDEPDGLEAMLEKIRKPRAFNEAVDQLEDTCLKATIPVINTRYKVDLGASLKKVRNVADIFDSADPKFEGVQKNSSSYIGSILHETSFNTMAIPGRMSKDVNCKSVNMTVAYEHSYAYFLIGTEGDAPKAPIISAVFVGGK